MTRTEKGVYKGKTMDGKNYVIRCLGFKEWYLSFDEKEQIRITANSRKALVNYLQNREIEGSAV